MASHDHEPENLAGGGLQPVDADGAEGVALALEGGVDGVPALQHAAGGLRVDDFGAVDGGQQEHAGEVGEQCQRQQRSGGEPMAFAQRVEQAGAGAIQPFQRQGEETHAPPLLKGCRLGSTASPRA